MKTIKPGIIMNGVTGRMGTNQHLMRSIVEIIKQGGVVTKSGLHIMPDPILIGRNENKLAQLCARAGISKYTTNLEEALSDKN
ncbi:MAG: gfo/Idh/MocA family oxidoreductase, partial [Saprospiraceae bacterium]